MLDEERRGRMEEWKMEKTWKEEMS